MTKSIVAALSVLFLISGCGDDADPSANPDIPVTVLDMSGDLKTECEVPVSCTMCPIGTICAESSGHFNRHVPTCLKTCNSTSDCSTGELCALLYAEIVAQQGVCVSMTNPAPCGPIEATYHCDFPPAHCLDANTLVRPFSPRTASAATRRSIARPVAWTTPRTAGSRSDTATDQCFAATSCSLSSHSRAAAVSSLANAFGSFSAHL
jgi:hypothetical protein